MTPHVIGLAIRVCGWVSAFALDLNALLCTGVAKIKTSVTRRTPFELVSVGSLFLIFVTCLTAIFAFNRALVHERTDRDALSKLNASISQLLVNQITLTHILIDASDVLAIHSPTNTTSGFDDLSTNFANHALSGRNEVAFAKRILKNSRRSDFQDELRIHQDVLLEHLGAIEESQRLYRIIGTNFLRDAGHLSKADITERFTALSDFDTQTLSALNRSREELTSIEQLITSSIYKNRENSRIALIILCTLSLLSIVNLIYYVRSRLERPIYDLTGFLYNMSNGNYSDSITHQNELGPVGDAFRATEIVRTKSHNLTTAAGALEQNREILESILFHMDQGLCVYDADLRLSAWSNQLADTVGVDPEWFDVSKHMSDLIFMFADRGDYGDGDANLITEQRMANLYKEDGFHSHRYDRMMAHGKCVEINGSVLPNGGIVTTYTDITDRKKNEETIKQLALTDPLTQLANRNQFRSSLQDELELAETQSKMVGLALLDLDRFKPINDSYGHPTGDQVLVEVGTRIKDLLSDSDIVARLGGDEFALILPGLTDTKDAIKVLKKIIKIITHPFVINDVEISIGTSVGISFYPENDVDPDELIRKADVALYEAKAAGRGTYRIYDQQVDQRVNAAHKLEKELRRAIKNDEFRLAFQPQFDVTNNKIVCVEALLRWDHPEKGVLTPSTFLECAETTGLIIEIGTWVLHEAALSAQRWQDLGFEAMRVAVNISAKQFRGNELMKAARSALRRAKLDPQWLEFELTEQSIADDQDLMMRNLEDLRKLGISLAIDDFGTGYSSLSQLRAFPVDRVKIDRSFVQGVTKESQDDAIVKTIIDLGRNLNIEVVAEGIETEEQEEFLASLDCHQMQGFKFARPMLKGQFEDWYQSRYEKPKPARKPRKKKVNAKS